MGKFRTCVTGFFVGSLAAGLTVLLTTPRSGRELRYQINTTGENLKKTSKQIKSDISQLKNNFIELQSRSKHTLKSVGSDLKEAITNWKEDTNPVIQSLKADIEALKEKAEQAAKEMKPN